MMNLIFLIDQLLYKKPLVSDIQYVKNDLSWIFLQSLTDLADTKKSHQKIMIYESRLIDRQTRFEVPIVSFPSWIFIWKLNWGHKTNSIHQIHWLWKFWQPNVQEMEFLCQWKKIARDFKGYTSVPFGGIQRNR